MQPFQRLFYSFFQSSCFLFAWSSYKNNGLTHQNKRVLGHARKFSSMCQHAREIHKVTTFDNNKSKHHQSDATANFISSPIA